MNRFSTHECSTQRMWFTTPPIVMSGEEGSGADLARVSLSPKHFSAAVSRVYCSIASSVDRLSHEPGVSDLVTTLSVAEEVFTPPAATAP